MFNYKAAIQAVDYIIQNSTELKTLDKLSILKLLFFAERYSLRKFANSITGDKFVAMKHGPVASNTYDLINFKNSNHKDDINELLSKDGDYGIKSKSLLLNRDDYDELSDDDLEALDFAIEQFGKYSSRKLVDIAHKFKEWSKFENKLKQTSSSFPMQIDDFFLDTTEDTKEYDIIPKETVKLSHELVLNNGLFNGE